MAKVLYPDNPQDYKLCYADREGARLWFTTLPLNEQRGDDWGDAPFPYNAGVPYEPRVYLRSDGTVERAAGDWNEDGSPKWRIYLLYADSGYFMYESLSVDDINRDRKAWVTYWAYRDGGLILRAGDTLDHVVAEFKSAGIDYYLRAE